MSSDSFIALANLGIKIGVGTEANYRDYLPPGHMWDLGGQATHSTDSLDTVKGWIDRAIIEKSNQIIEFHFLVTKPVDPYQWAISDFRTLIDYIKVKQAAGLIVPITHLDFYNLSLGPVSIPA